MAAGGGGRRAEEEVEEAGAELSGAGGGGGARAREDGGAEEGRRPQREVLRGRGHRDPVRQRAALARQELQEGTRAGCAETGGGTKGPRPRSARGSCPPSGGPRPAAPPPRPREQPPPRPPACAPPPASHRPPLRPGIPEKCCALCPLFFSTAPAGLGASSPPFPKLSPSGLFRERWPAVDPVSIPPNQRARHGARQSPPRSQVPTGLRPPWCFVYVQREMMKAGGLTATEQALGCSISLKKAPTLRSPVYHSSPPPAKRQEILFGSQGIGIPWQRPLLKPFLSFTMQSPPTWP